MISELNRLANLSRLRYLAGRSAAYAVQVFKRPIQAPRVLYYGLTGVHLGEYLGLDRPWFRALDVRTVLDVGANAGQFSSAVARIFPAARIYAFEPLADCHAAMVKRMAGCGKFQAFCIALGDRTETVQMFRNEFSKSSSLLPMNEAHKTAFPWTAHDEPVPVRLDTLDNVAQEMDLDPPVLLKLDVQGLELQVLRGAESLLNSIDVLISEVSFCALYDGQPLFDEIYSFLTERGFAYYGSMGALTAPTDGTILQEDALFMRRR